MPSINFKSSKPFFFASLFFAVLFLITIIIELVFAWNPPTAGAPNPAGQTLYSDSSNNIGIGTLYPGAKLEIYSTSSDSVLKLSRQSATSTLFKLGTDAVLVINNNNSDVLYIKNGKIGIGVPDPADKLSVNGTIRSLSGGFVFPDGTTQATAGSGSTPTGAVMFFNLATCPTGWTALAAAQGRYLVGLPSAGTLAGTAGTALSNLEWRTAGAITATQPSHIHNLYDTRNSEGATANDYESTQAAEPSITVNSATPLAGTNAPYLQLLVCQKD